MPYKLIDNKSITVQHKRRPSDYSMPSMQMASDHYNIGIVTSGDRRTITPNESFEYHAGYVSMMPPFLLHRTLSLSKEPYEGYLIKFSLAFANPFIENGGQAIFDALYEKKIHHFNPENTKIIVNMFREIYTEYQKERSYSEQILSGMLFRLFDTIWYNRLSEESHKFNTPLTEPILNAVTIINQFYAEDITLTSVSKNVGLAASYLSRLFKTQMGKTFSEYVMDVRISAAKQLLMSTNKSVMEIATETGFCNGDYLSTCFKKCVGLSPLNFRKMNRHY
ncbi:MAG: helix-turn-helix transcriptional regulator [Lachnospiraceae bacterium]|nr:helix-turn-helix transcriptional regulator [Lachnospiraceae bacterium]